MNSVYWKLRFKLSRFIYPHQCTPLPKVFAIFHGGPADGKELKIVVSNEVIIPVMKPIKAEFTLGNSETPEYFHGYDKHFYRIRHVIYDYLEEKSKLE